MSDPTRRFSGRVENYIRYRPHYPASVLDALDKECGLTPRWTVADIGSGTGILTEPFLRRGNTVYAVEPNLEMRAAAERILGHYPNFRSVDARAEATTLDEECIDLVVAGQAFHWFDREQARDEFRRVLRPGGWVMLVWNERETDTTPFLQEYEAFLHRYATDYAAVDHRRMDSGIIGAFFRGGSFESRSFRNRQEFDFDGLKGRLLSSSYVPDAGHPGFEPMLDSLAQLFERHASDQRVAFEYVTLMYFGRWG